MHGFRIVAWIMAAVYATIPAVWIFTHRFYGRRRHRLAERWRRKGGAAYWLLGCYWMCSILFVMWATARGRVASLYQSGVTSWSVALLFWTAGAMIYFRIPEFGVSRFIGKYEVNVAESGAQQVISTGMHSVVRHPIYLGHLLTLSGWAVASGTVAAYELLALALLTAPLMIWMEERELVSRFGDAYREYQRQVPMVVPRSVKIFSSPPETFR